MNIKICLLKSNTDFDIEYTYIVPDSIRPEIDVGVFVNVPFGVGNRNALAVVVDICEDSARDYINSNGRRIKLKSITSVSGKYAPVSAETVRLCREMQRRYICSFGDALKCMLPPEESNAGKARYIRLNVDKARAEELIKGRELRGIKQIKAVEILSEAENQTVQEDILKNEYDISSSVIRALAQKAIIVIEMRKAAQPAAEPTEYGKTAEKYPPKVLNSEQNEALRKIKRIAKSGEYGGILLHGITGSGKTEVYLQAISDAVESGGTAIMLVPEISLTPQTVARFKGRFGNIVAVFHSRLSVSQKRREYERVKSGEAKIAIGARSAVFAPFGKNLKLIILDEEQENSYKSFDSAPYYHAGEIAVMRMKILGGAVVFGSATPRITTYYRARNGELEYAYMGKRAASGSLPAVSVVNMREELGRGNNSVFSERMYLALKRNYEEGRQSIIFVPRRGYSGRLICAECGKAMTCGKCSVAMTYHKSSERLICHYCGNTVPAPVRCPSCGGSFNTKSIGTEMVEREIRRLFPKAGTVRMDADTTGRKDGHKILLERFENENIPFLIGTQMIAKGLDFPNVTLVCVVNADGLLNIQEYNAGERAFQLLTQVFGRAGRGEKEGFGILQTMDDDQPVYASAIRQDYCKFAEYELAFRRAMDYPPFKAMCTVAISGTDDKDTFALAAGLCKKLRAIASNEDGGAEVFNVTRAVPPKINDRYRWSFVVKSGTLKNMLNIMKIFVYDALPEIGGSSRAKYRIGIDIEE